VSPLSLLLPGAPRVDEASLAAAQDRQQARREDRPSHKRGGGKPGRRSSNGSRQRYAILTTNATAGGSTVRRGQFTRQGAASGARRGRGYDIAFSLGRSAGSEYRVRAPSISLPQVGPRMVSGFLTALLAFVLYSMWNSPAFAVESAEVVGNQRLSGPEINAMLGVRGRPIFEAVPARLEIDLRTAYPDLSAVSVHVGFPNRLVVEVSERLPLLAWYQDGAVTWIDAAGVAFLPRGGLPAGEAGALPQVNSNGAPPQVQMDPGAPLYEQVFVDPAVVQAMLTLHPYVPAGIPMIYDPRYGMGWQDPRGWFVYFGQNTDNIPMKLVIYQSIVETFVRQGIQPMLISVEHLDAPFFK
jgi:hypothetical protein